jgi:hypothetical protein
VRRIRGGVFMPLSGSSHLMAYRGRVAQWLAYSRAHVVALAHQEGRADLPMTAYCTACKRHYKTVEELRIAPEHCNEEALRDANEPHLWFWWCEAALDPAAAKNIAKAERAIAARQKAIDGLVASLESAGNVEDVDSIEMRVAVQRRIIEGKELELERFRCAIVGVLTDSEEQWSSFMPPSAA